MDGQKRFQNDTCGRRNVRKRIFFSAFSNDSGYVWTTPKCQELNLEMLILITHMFSVFVANKVRSLIIFK